MQQEYSAQQRHDALKAFIIEKIRHKQGIPFSEYMHDALYTPELGYYAAHLNIFGATQEADFITAPEISSLFGESLANVCARVLQEIPEGVIFELGAGTGKLANDLLNALEKLDALPKEYWIFDPSAALRKQQKEYLKHQKVAIKWFNTLPTDSFSGIVIGNEVLDAMPAQCFQVTDNACFELFVTENKGQFESEYRETCQPEILALADFIRAQNSPEILQARPYQSERLPELKTFFTHFAQTLEKGTMLLIDYGFPRHEFYHPDRHMGTLMCHQNQKTHPDPYHQVGLQDITTHVDFTDVAEKASDAGFSVAGYTQQAAFLMNAGLLSLYNENPNHMAMNLLTSPSEMGELFKIIALTKNLDLFPFPGFEHFDKRHNL